MKRSRTRSKEDQQRTEALLAETEQVRLKLLITVERLETYTEALDQEVQRRASMGEDQ